MRKKLTSGYATWFTAGVQSALLIMNVIDDVITPKL